MNNPRGNARRWLPRAENNLSMAGVLLEGGSWSGDCFRAEQTDQLALKTYLFGLGRRYILIHSVRELALA